MRRVSNATAMKKSCRENSAICWCVQVKRLRSSQRAAADMVSHPNAMRLRSNAMWSWAMCRRRKRRKIIPRFTARQRKGEVELEGVSPCSWPSLTEKQEVFDSLRLLLSGIDLPSHRQQLCQDRDILDVF